MSFVKWGENATPSVICAPTGGGLGSVYVIDVNGVMLWGYPLNKEDVKYGVKVLGVGY